MSKASVQLAASIGISCAICGCGGGGSSSIGPPAPDLGTAEGLWGGTTGSGRSIAGLVLDDGEYWFIYSAAANDAVIAGAVQGSSTSSNGKFTSSNGINFNLEGMGVSAFTLSGTYTAKNLLGGTFTYSSGATDTFTGTYSAVYESAASLATIAGTYTGTAATSGGIENATVTVSGTGIISGRSASGCSFTGTATARAKGNAYDLSVTFDGGICANATNTVTGVAYYVASNSELVAAALNAGRSDGFLFGGVKP